MRVIGTAGHVDHGKSTLVQALTGINPDRLKEEQEREMTIDLGFAWLTLPSGLEVSIIDVPGHEDFIKNMLAGVGGIDVALFVVASDEGVMPQTREHLAILDLLQIRDGVVALTKSDLITDREWLELVQEEVREELKDTVLEHANIVPVSARSGDGLRDLLAELDRLLQSPLSRSATGRPRVPIDRFFTMPGFGTIVTGTLIDGPLRSGEEVELLPPKLKVRIRGLQTHKAKVDEAIPPTRLAVNLTGVDKDQLQRGYVLTSPGWLQATSEVDARLRVLRGAPRPLPHNATLDFFTGAAQCEARIRLLDRQEIAPGEESWVQLSLSAPVAMVKGDRFVVRQASPSLTIGGGVVVDPLPQRRHRRFQSDVLERLESLTRGNPQEVLLHELEREEPSEVAALVSRSTLGRTPAADALRAILQSGQAVVLGSAAGEIDAPTGGSQLVMSADGWSALVHKGQSLLAEYHRRYPLRSGMPREELKSRLGLSLRAFNDVVAKAAAQALLNENEAVVSLTTHRVALGAEQQRQVDRLLATFRQSPYSPPSLAECEAALGSEVLTALLESRTLVKVSDVVIFAAETYDTMTEAVISHLRREGHVTLGQVRDMFSTSRKYAQALLEHLDDKRITRRVGDERVLR